MMKLLRMLVAVLLGLLLICGGLMVLERAYPGLPIPRVQVPGLGDIPPRLTVELGRSGTPDVRVDAGRARAELAGLRVAGRAPKTGYDRDLFLHSWPATGGGCDLRDTILARDLVAGTKEPAGGCEVAGGLVADPYSGRQISTTKADVDHAVPLGDAWQKGAQQWTPQQRRAFATDPDNLVSVDASLNRAKGDADAATWLPPHKPGRCAYAARQVRVKAKYHVWVTEAERVALDGLLSRCPKVAGR